MTGRALLVAPILTRNNSRRVYLPAGVWYDFWTGERVEGGRWITREANIETTPVYVRGGTILPLAAPAQCTDQLSTDGLTLRVYPDAEGRLPARYSMDSVDFRLKPVRKRMPSR